MLVYVHDRSPKRKRKKKPKRLTEAERQHSDFLRSVGYKGSSKKKPQPLKREPSVSTTSEIPSRTLVEQFEQPGGFKKSIDDFRWKRHNEKPETISAIEAKAKRTAPAYSKGGYQYITDGSDISDLGRKK